MGVLEVFRFEVGAFLLGLVVLLGARLTCGKIDLRGLFGSDGDASKVNPERVLLFVATVVVGAVYIIRMILSGVGALPDLGAGWLVLFGASCAIYLATKAFRTFRFKKS